MSYKPTRIFAAVEGDYSVDNAGPEALKADLDAVMKMFDPTATHSNGETGGIGTDNLNFNFADESMSASIGSEDIDGLTANNNVYAQLTAIVNVLLTHTNLTDADTLGYIGGKLNNVDSDGQSIIDSLYAMIVDRYSKSATESLIASNTNVAITSLSYDDASGKLTATTKGGTTTEVFDLNVEMIPVEIGFMEEDNTTYIYIRSEGESGTRITKSNITNFVTQYSFTDSADIDFTVTDGVGRNKSVTATIKDGAVTTAKLDATIFSTMEGYATTASNGASSASTSASNASTSEGNARQSAISASGSASSASASAGSATNSASSASSSATTASQKATLAESYTHGGTNTREGEDTDNCAYYLEQCQGISGGDFVTHQEYNADMATVSGNIQSAANLASQADAKADAIGTYTVNGKQIQTNPTLSASDIGLGNVGNFKAVSTVASQGLTDAEKSNARTNIGAGTSSLELGTTSTTAAKGNHTHSSYVPKTRKINNKELSADITLTADDVGARPNTWTPTASDVGATAKTDFTTENGKVKSLTIDSSTYSFSGGILPQIIVTAPTGSTVTVTGASTQTKTVTLTSVTFEVDSLCEYIVTATLGNNTATATVNVETVKNYEVALAYYFMGGVKIAKNNENPSSAVTYIGDAEGHGVGYEAWKNENIFANIKPCILYNGVVQGYLNPNDLTKYENGTTAPTGYGYDVMVEIPKLGYKFSEDSSYRYIYVTDKEDADGYCYLAHSLDSAGDCDKIYVGAYLGSVSSNNLYSKKGVSPTVSTTIGNFRTYASNRGAGYQQLSFYPVTLLQCLFLLMYKNRDSQSALGRGFVDGNSAVTTTGTTYNKGVCYGETTGKYSMCFMHIEDFWGNARQWVDGLFCNSSFSILTAYKGFNDTGSSYPYSISSGFSSNTGGWISDIQGGNNSGFLVKATSGSSTTYWGDRGYLYGGYLGCFGGDCSDGEHAGAFCLDVCYSSSSSGARVGARLCFKHKS